MAAASVFAAINRNPGAVVGGGGADDGVTPNVAVVIDAAGAQILHWLETSMLLDLSGAFVAAAAPNRNAGAVAAAAEEISATTGEVGAVSPNPNVGEVGAAGASVANAKLGLRRN